jgi:hypothetical protein
VASRCPDVVALGFLACLVFAFGLLSGRLEGTVVSAPMVFVTAGLVAGATGILDFGAPTHATGGHSREAVFLVAELALVIVARLKSGMRQRFDDGGVTTTIGPTRFYPTVRAAVAACRAEDREREAR